MTNTVKPTRQPPIFLRMMLFLATTTVVLAGMRSGAPGVLLALAEFGVTRTLLAILGVIVIYQLAEYGLDPFLLSRGLQLPCCRLPLLHPLGLAPRRAGGIYGHAHHPAAGRHARHLPGDPLACQPHDEQASSRRSCSRRGGRAHRMSGQAQVPAKATDERHSHVLSRLGWCARSDATGDHRTRRAIDQDALRAPREFIRRSAGLPRALRASFLSC